MAIKTLDVSSFDKITGEAPVENISNDSENEISDEDWNYLYEKGLDELKMLTHQTEWLKSFMLDMFCGTEVLLTDEVSDFFLVIDLIASKLIPAILEANFEEASKYCNREESNFEQARNELFTNLYRKYLER